MSMQIMQHLNASFSSQHLGLDVSPLPLPLAWCFSRWSRRLTLGCKPSKRMEWIAIVKAVFCLCVVCFAMVVAFLWTCSFCSGSTLDQLWTGQVTCQKWTNSLTKVRGLAWLEIVRTHRDTSCTAFTSSSALSDSKCFTRGDRRTQAIWKPAKNLCIGGQTAENPRVTPSVGAK